jgi:MHS family proline/betaine transporter-like MFS transporter
MLSPRLTITPPVGHVRANISVGGVKSRPFAPLSKALHRRSANLLNTSTLPRRLQSMQTAARKAGQPSRAELRRIVTAIVIGNGFVAYDFTVYSFSAVVIGNLFFPSSNPASSLLMRPLGAIMIGHIADSRGRKAGLTASLTLMTLGTWLIACLPGYASIGPAATVLMVLARLIQGLAAGGEIGPASASLMESVAYRHRCFMVSWRGASQGAAAFAAALIGASDGAAIARCNA